MFLSTIFIPTLLLGSHYYSPINATFPFFAKDAKEKILNAIHSPLSLVINSLFQI